MNTNNHFKKLFEELPFGVLITTGDPENPLTVYQNIKYSEISGYSLEEMRGLNPKILQGLRTDRKVIDRLKDCLKREVVFIGSTFNYRKSDQEYLLSWTIFPMPFGGVPYFISIQRDLSDSSIDPAKEVWVLQKEAWNMTKDLLNHIQLAAEMIEDASDEEQTELISVIETSVRTITNMNRLVEFAASLLHSELTGPFEK